MAPTADITQANDVHFSDGGDLSWSKLKISKMGKNDGQADNFNFDLGTFNDDFDVSIKSEGVEDSFIINNAQSCVVNSGVYTITYVGSDMIQHTVTIDPGVASMIINVVCLTPDVRVATPLGPRRVGDLQIGDLVETKDHGAQPLRWIGRRRMVFPKGEHRFKPILISKGAIDGLVPVNDVLVSPQHRILLQGAAVLNATDKSEVLAPAKALVNVPGIRQVKGKNTVEYISLLFDRHELIEADGMLTESFLPRPYAAEYLPKDDVETINELSLGVFSEISNSVYPAARPLIKVQEARKLSKPAIASMHRAKACQTALA